MIIYPSIIYSLITSVDIPSPDPLGYPVPPWILQSLSYLTLTFHFLAVNFTIGGSLLLLWAHFRKKQGHEGAAYFFGSSIPLGVSYIITLGIPPLLFLQVLYGQLFYSSSILIGAFWIQVIPVLILAYSGYYYHKLRRETHPRLQWLVIAINVFLLFYIGYIYVNNLTLSISPEKWLTIYAAHPGGGILNHGEPTIIPRLLLFLSGSFAVSGLALIWRGAYLQKWGYEAEGKYSQSFGLKAFWVSPVLWVISAIGIYVARPNDISNLLSSNSVIILLVVGVISALIACLFAILANGKQKLLYPLISSLGVFGGTACVVIFRDLVRLNQLKPYFELSSIPVNAQWGMFALFVFSLTAALILIIVLSVKVFPKIAEQARSRFDNSDTT